MPPRPTRHIQTRSGDNVRIGPISIITLIVVICMAVMGVLTLSTSQASETISERQASATHSMYLNETAAQEFVADVDTVLAGLRQSGSAGRAGSHAAAVEDALDRICEQARASADGRVDCIASVSDTTVNAEFTCDDTRLLSISLSILDDATYRIDQWKATSAQQDAQTGGSLWLG